MSIEARIGRLEGQLSAAIAVTTWLEEVAETGSLVAHARAQIDRGAAPPLIAIPRQIAASAGVGIWIDEGSRKRWISHEEREALFLIRLVLQINATMLDLLERAEAQAALLGLRLRARGSDESDPRLGAALFPEGPPEPDWSDWLAALHSLAIEVVAAEHAWRMLESRFFAVQVVGARDRRMAVVIRRRVGVLWAFGRGLDDPGVTWPGVRELRREVAQRASDISSSIVEQAIIEAERDHAVQMPRPEVGPRTRRNGR